MNKPTDKELFHILSMVCVISVLMTVVSIIIEAWSLPGLTHAFFSAGAAIASFVFAVKFKSKMGIESHEKPLLEGSILKWG